MGFPTKVFWSLTIDEILFNNRNLWRGGRILWLHNFPKHLKLNVSIYLIGSVHNMHCRVKSMYRNSCPPSLNKTIKYQKLFHVCLLWRDFMLKMGLSWFFLVFVMSDYQLPTLVLGVSVLYRKYCHIHARKYLSENEFYSKIPKYFQ